MNANFEKLAMRSGGYSLPFLIKLSDIAGNINLYYINDRKDLVYNGNTYKATAFKYTPNNFVIGFDGGGTLNIAAVDETGLPNSIIDLVETYREMKLEVIGVLLDSTVSELKRYSHHYGKVTVKDMTVSFTFDADDRTQMTFPALIWNNSNNRGNA